MKEIIRQKVPEIAKYYCDFKGKPEKAYNTIIIRGDYGSDFDLSYYHFDLSNSAVKEILDFIALKLQSTDSIKYHMRGCDLL